MSLDLQYHGPGRFRDRVHLEWLMPALERRARELGWNGRVSLIIRDSDGYALGGFVPHN